MVGNAKKITLFLLAGIAIILVIVSTRVKIPYSIKSKAFIVPSMEYNLVRTSDGTLVTTLKDNINGVVKNYGITAFQRGDVVQFSLAEGILEDRHLNKGDTIGWILSNQEQITLVELKGELGVLKAEHMFYTTGQKPEDVETAKEEWDLAKQNLALQKTLIERSKVLHQDSVISQQEYDLVLNNLKVKEIELSIAEARYMSIITGEKKEQLDLIKAKINSIESQIDQISSRLAYFTFISPISGNLLAQRDVDTLFGGNVISIGNVDQLAAIVPVQLKERTYIDVGDAVFIQNSKGTITHIDNSIKLIEGRQSFYVTVFWENQSKLLPGSITEATLGNRKITLAEYFLRMFSKDPGK